MPIAAMLAGTVHQPLDLSLGEIASLDCQVYDAWCAFLGCRFHADKPCLRVSYCICYTLFLHSRKGKNGCTEHIAIASRMEAPERARSMVARAAGQPHFCLATERLCGPPGRGDFLVSNFHPGAIPGNLRRSWRGNGGGVVLATSLGKILRGVLASISVSTG